MANSGLGAKAAPAARDAQRMPEALRAPSVLHQMRRAAHDIALRSPLLRWRFGGTPGDRLLIVPQGLRTLDPSFLSELEAGSLGLAGAVAPFAGGSPFAIPAPTPAWTEALNSFGWLRHLRAAETPAARQLAEDWVLDWLDRNKRKSGDAWEAHVTARRFIAMLSGSGFLLNGSDAQFHETYVVAANTHLRFLAQAYANQADGLERLLVLTAIMYGGLCIADQESFLADFEAAFVDTLNSQILPDGSAVSRETTSIVEVVLDLLPLERCFTARELAPPPPLRFALQRALRFIAHMRLGDGMLARFNGVGPTWPDRVAAVLAYRDIQTPPIEEARYSGYARMERGNTTVLMDVGVPPPYDKSTRAHAGCVSFEMSSGTAPLIVNCGAPGPADADWGPLARGTAAHSTLVLNDASSSILVRNPDDEMRLGGIPIEGPERVERVVSDNSDGGATISAWHDGYLQRFGIRHERNVMLSASGHTLLGTDRLSGGGKLFAGRGKEVQTFAVRFHLHPRARVRRGAENNVIEIRIGNDETWEFSTPELDVHLEESVFLAELSGPLQSVQLVLRGKVTDLTTITWKLRNTAAPDETFEPAKAAVPVPDTAKDVRPHLRVVDGEARSLDADSEPPAKVSEPADKSTVAPTDDTTDPA